MSLPANLHQFALGIIVAHDFVELPDSLERGRGRHASTLFGIRVEHDPHLRAHQHTEVFESLGSCRGETFRSIPRQDTKTQRKENYSSHGRPIYSCLPSKVFRGKHCAVETARRVVSSISRVFHSSPVRLRPHAAFGRGVFVVNVLVYSTRTTRKPTKKQSEYHHLLFGSCGSV